ARAEPPRPATAPRSPQKIVAIRVTAAHPTRFDGALLREVVTAARFTHGRYDIFHRLDPDGRPIMSLASLLEPGTFDPAKMDTAAYPGIAVFTVMPGPLPAARAFDELLDTARAMATRLGGQLQDDRGAPLSGQRGFKPRQARRGPSRGYSSCSRKSSPSNAPSGPRAAPDPTRWQHARPPGASISCVPRSRLTTIATPCSTLRR